MTLHAQAFADILASNETFAAPMEETYKMLDLNPADTTTLEQYLQVRQHPSPVCCCAAAWSACMQRHTAQQISSFMHVLSPGAGVLLVHPEEAEAGRRVLAADRLLRVKGRGLL
jgi:hypothetical protein